MNWPVGSSGGGSGSGCGIGIGGKVSLKPSSPSPGGMKEIGAETGG
jgi:hypothetical protein